MSIFRPKWKSRDPKGFPILIWIHGGSWMMGSTEQYGYKRVSDNFIPQGIIIVSIQYRLGPWGFFSSGDSRMPGNLGLWDQYTAIKQVNKFAPFFGGDKNRITVMGQSAGSASVSWLSVAERAHKLFQQTIEISGSVFGVWARSDETIETSLKLAASLDCPDTKDLKKCMKNLTQEDIQDQMLGMGIFKQNLNFAFFNPRMDGDFLKAKSFEEAIKKAPKRPTLIGNTNKESLFWSAEQLGLVPADEIYNRADDEIEEYSREKLEDFIRKCVATKERYGSRAAEAGDEIISHFADSKAPKKPDNLFYFDRFTDLLSSIHFETPQIREALNKAAAGYPTFYEVFSYQKSKEITEYKIDGAPHGAELDALFHSFVYAGFEETKDDPKIQKIMAEIFSAFIRTGNPSTETLTIPPVTSKVIPYVDINLEPKIKQNPFFHNYLFWERMTKKYGYDVSTGTKVTKFSKPIRRRRVQRQVFN
uniref:Carboxylic ester hydrolase n=1 Tax=Panagrolaimus superbus TaxID=310955 RepID=A0A914Z443_9BILA